MKGLADVKFQGIKDEIMGIILMLDEYSVSKDVGLIGDARRRITALHQEHPKPAKVLWDIAIKLQRDNLEKVDDDDNEY